MFDVSLFFFCGIISTFNQSFHENLKLQIGKLWLFVTVLQELIQLSWIQLDLMNCKFRALCIFEMHLDAINVKESQSILSIRTATLKSNKPSQYNIRKSYHIFQKKNIDPNAINWKKVALKIADISQKISSKIEHAITWKKKVQSHKRIRKLLPSFCIIYKLFHFVSFHSLFFLCYSPANFIDFVMLKYYIFTLQVTCFQHGSYCLNKLLDVLKI